MGERGRRTMKSVCIVAALCIAAAAGEVYFEENFGEGWESRWVTSTHKDDFGEFKASAGKNYADENDQGLQTSQDAKFYAVSAAFPEFSNKDKTLVVCCFPLLALSLTCHLMLVVHLGLCWLGRL